MSKIFYLGATGYAGGHLLVGLKERYSDLNVTALVRDLSAFDAVRNAGATPVHGDFANVDLIAELSAQADIVMNMASSDHVGCNEAILRGMKARYNAGKPKGILIHMSGTGIFMDDGKEGKFNENAKACSDDEEDIQALRETMIHGPVDIPILRAGVEGYLVNYTIAPSLIHGPGRGPVGCVTSILTRVPLVLSKKYKQATYMGEGTNTIGSVHVDDLIDLCLRVFDLARSGQHPPSPYARFYIATDQLVSWGLVAGALGKALYARGLVEKPEARGLTYEEGGRFARILSGSEMVKSKRAYTLDWNPSRKERFTDTMEEDLALL